MSMLQKVFGIGALPQKEFASLVMQMGVEQGQFKNPQLDLDAFMIADEGRKMFLHNLHRAFLQQGRWQRRKFITEHMLAKPDVPETWAEIAPMLLANLRSGAYLSIAETHGMIMRAEATEPLEREPDNRILRKPIAPGLFATLVIDTPTSLLTVLGHHRDAWGVSFDDALELALRNLREKSDQPFEQITDGVWRATWTDSLAAARILFPELLQRVCSDPLVCVPTRDTLLVADSSRPGSFMKLLALSMTFDEQPYRISRRIFQLDHKRLRLADVPADAVDGYNRRILEEHVTDYEDERALHAKLENADETLAECMGLERNGRAFSATRWYRSMDGDNVLLPEVDMVQLVCADGGWIAPWEKLVRFLTPVDRALPRWRIGEFPDSEWLDENAELIAKKSDLPSA
ncbi:hypothetical protein BH11MYX2_BH11MYX2_16850 [soil metagenome]